MDYVVVYIVVDFSSLDFSEFLTVHYYFLNLYCL